MESVGWVTPYGDDRCLPVGWAENFMKLKNVSGIVFLAAVPIALFASSAVDRKIESAAKASYNYRAVLDDRVKVKATDGVVTLSGTVNDEGDRGLAADTVENLPGVLRVDNQIKVDPTAPEHSDGWMALKIRSRLLVKGSVSAANTKVAVENGNVLLTGSADNLAQKELTAAYAKDIEGVKSVKNEIVIRASEAGPTAGETIDDASITTQMKYALLNHKSTSALKTKVETTEGDIVVTGEAGSAAEKALVTKLAWDVRGVRSVRNNMTVRE